MSQVICLGESLMDRIADEVGQELNLIQNWTNFPGGAPANVACALSRLGTSSSFLGCISRDTFGEELISTLRFYDVDRSLVQRHLTAITRQVLVTRDARGGRAFGGFNQSHQVFADSQLSFRKQDASFFSSASFLYLGSLILAEPQCRSAVEQYLQMAQFHGLQIFMDVNLRPMFWHASDSSKSIIFKVLAHINYLKVASEEAQWLFETQNPTQICDRFPKLQGVFVTAGDQGCHYQLHGFSGACPAFSVQSIDTTGAGDGFVAGCLHQLLTCPTFSHPSHAESLVRYANAVGGLSTLHIGAIAPDPTPKMSSNSSKMAKAILYNLGSGRQTSNNHNG
ncbi:MAG: carbohydrate kinase [Acaryochloridaceae cyanobacterium RL_2_7]|nr:carbohydrate kinase [Acaryochloridaceae cyanobacterium RL_2_7]